MELLDTLKEVMIYTLESAACLSAFYLFYYFFLRKETCFKYNRFYLLAAVVFSIVFPLIEVNYNPQATPTVFNSLHEVSNEPIIVAKKGWIFTVTAKSEKPFLLWWEALALLYALGVIFLGLRLFVQIRTIRDYIWYKRHNLRYRDRYYLINTEGTLPTFSFFSYLFWDDSQNLSALERKQILDHEKVHIKQRHSIDIMLMEVLKAFFWFNPLMYLYKSTFEEIHEYEADHVAVKQNGSTVYTQLLIKLVFQKMGFNLGSHFAKNKTLKRVDMIKAEKKINPLRLMIPIPIAFLLFFIFSCEAINFNQSVEIKALAYQVGFDNDDIKPVPSSGFENWITDMSNSISTKSSAIDNYGADGEVVVTFDVTTSGEVANVDVIQSLKKDYDRAVIQSILRSTKWTPGVKDGEVINTKIKMPVRFKLP